MNAEMFLVAFSPPPPSFSVWVLGGRGALHPKSRGCDGDGPALAGAISRRIRPRGEDSGAGTFRADRVVWQDPPEAQRHSPHSPGTQKARVNTELAGGA